MPVNSTHLDYEANAAAWLRAYANSAGEARMKTSFLPARLLCA